MLLTSYSGVVFYSLVGRRDDVIQVKKYKSITFEISNTFLQIPKRFHVSYAVETQTDNLCVMDAR